MKLTYKKIIAREFLILLTCSLVFVISYLGTIPYNRFLNSKINKQESSIMEIDKTINDLRSFYIPKINNQKKFFETSKENDWHTKSWEYDMLWSKLQRINQNDSISYKWDYEWGKDFKDELRDFMGFNGLPDFRNYITSNSLSSEDQEKEIEVKELEFRIKEIEESKSLKQSKILNSDDKIELALICVIIVGIFVFPFRYLYYTLKWSLIILKQKE